MKRVVVLVAVDLCLKRRKSSPKRCARNLIELGLSAYPDKLTQNEQNSLYNDLMKAITDGDISASRDLFSTAFL